MDPLALAAWSFPVLLLLIFLRVPIGLSMLVLGLVGSWLVYGSLAPLLNQMKSLAYSTFSSHSLSIVPSSAIASTKSIFSIFWYQSTVSLASLQR